MISAGEQFGRYRIISSIGEGGMGKVFLAEDVELERRVALKVLPAEVAGERERIARFIQEAKAASALNHPNILTIYEIGNIDGTRFITSEHIEGVTLREKLNQRTLTLPFILDIAIQTSLALQAAHSRNIVHRDIKPENIMIRHDELVKVLDFGLAKLTEQDAFARGDSLAPTREQVRTHSGMVLGTPSYMSPEQARGRPIDSRTDIFSLGVVLYEMLTGKQPFHGESNSDIIAAILMKDPLSLSSLRPGIPEELENTVSRMLSKDREQRQQNAGGLLLELRNVKQQLDPATESIFNRSRLEPVDRETKTKNLGAGTDKTVNAAATAPNDGGSSNAIPIARFTDKLSKAFRSRSFAPLIVGVGVAVLLAYFLLSGGRAAPTNIEALALYNSGTEALRSGAYYKASKLLEESIRVDGNYAPAHARLAEAWLELDYFGRAQGAMLRVHELARDRDSIFPQFSRTDDDLYMDAVNATLLRNLPGAIRNYETLVSRHPDEAYAHLDLGRALERNEEIDRAIEAYEKATQLDSHYAPAFLRLGSLRSRKGEFEKALAEFAKAESIYDRENNDEGIAEVKFSRGLSFNAQDKLKPAMEQFEQVTNSPRANKYQKIRAMLQMSSVLCSEGKTEPAEQLASNAILLAKEERMENLVAGGLIDLGNAFHSRQDTDSAEQHYRQALAFRARTRDDATKPGPYCLSVACSSQDINLARL